MKKIASILLVLTLIISSFAGCAKKDSTNTGATTAPEPTKEASNENPTEERIRRYH